MFEDIREDFSNLEEDEFGCLKSRSFISENEGLRIGETLSISLMVFFNIGERMMSLGKIRGFLKIYETKEFTEFDLQGHMLVRLS